ncbi:MAG: orotate phosphoribosyltransferase [Gammaproteobacteria bacterium]|jgi:orotate phosphoribosyltransferase
MHDYQREFIEFAIRNEVLRFGEFTLKSGRTSPYFFNSGLFNSGATIARLGRYYAETIMRSGLACDVLFGPAYKGIPLAVATAVALADRHGRDIAYAFNRKELKDHGEGGIIVGAALRGRVLIIDDVISAGTSVSESIRLIKDLGAEPAGVVVALDRQERSDGELSAIQQVEQRHGIPVMSIITLDQITTCMAKMTGTKEALTRIRAYREQYGV